MLLNRIFTVHVLLYRLLYDITITLSVVQGPRGFGGHRLLSWNDIYFWKLQIPCYQDMGMTLVKAVQFFLYYVIMVTFSLLGLIYISGQNARYSDIFIDKNVITNQFM